MTNLITDLALILSLSVQQFGIKVAPEKYDELLSYDKTFMHNVFLLLQAPIPMTPPALLQRPWRGHLQESWMSSHQTPKGKVGLTCLQHIDILTVL